METMCLFYICFYSDTIFFVWHKRRNSHLKIVQLVKFSLSAVLSCHLRHGFACFPTLFYHFFRSFSPFFYQSHIPLYHLVFAATADVSYLVLLLFRELAFAQEVLLSGLVRNSIIIATTIIVITIHHPHQITTWNSSMPVETTICWSRVESPKSAASLSSLDRAWLLT